MSDLTTLARRRSLRVGTAIALGAGLAGLAVAASGRAWLSSHRGPAASRATAPPRAGPAPA